MSATLDVVIVSFNTRDELAACLQSLYNHKPRDLQQVFVVDNASTDGSAALVGERWPETRVIALDRNVGFGAANNVAIRESSADFVLLLNSDTIVPAGTLDRLVDRLTATRAAAVGPRLIDADGRIEVSFGRMLTPWTEFIQSRNVRFSRQNTPAARQRIKTLAVREHEVDWVSGACLLARREAVVEAGLFDERYFMYEEDVDLCAALRARGGRIVFTPLAEVVHLRGRSVARLTAGARAMYDQSHLAFYRKHSPAWAPLLALWQKARGRG